LQSNADANGDGRVDRITDFNGDGMPDGVVPNSVIDTDADSEGNHLETDSDNDGESDLVAAGGNDADGDGQVDQWSDSDNDGIPDNVDVQLTGGEDVDGDGIDDRADPDFVEISDFDGDGIVDTYDPSPFGDGFIPLTQPDLPVLPPAVDGLVVSGLAGNGCSVSNNPNSKRDPIFISLILIACMMLMARLKRRRRMILSPLVAVVYGGAILGGCSSLPQVQSTQTNVVNTTGTDTQAYSADEQFEDRIQRHFYVGIGLGRSHLDPDDSASERFDVNDRVQNAGSIHFGVDLSRQLSVEGQYVHLGSAGFSPEGSLEYREFSGSALIYAGKNRHNYKRRGLSAFGRLGGGKLINKANLGVEYSFRSGLGLRAEYISHEEDIKFGQVALTYRFGKREKEEPTEVTEPLPVPAPEPEVQPIVEPEPEPVVEPVISEGVSACLELNGVLDGVNFHSNSAELTEESVGILQEIANTLLLCESKLVTVSAHTDSQGNASYNEGLSQRRANSVVEFFISVGINPERMNSIAYGEREPIDSNATAAGRRNNRRVELSID